MKSTITIEPIESIPEGVDVCHYDELTEEAKHEFQSCTEGDEDLTVSSDRNSRMALSSCVCDVVKFTQYYQINRSPEQTE